MTDFSEPFGQFARCCLPPGLSEAATLRFQSLARPVQGGKDAAVCLDEASDHLVFVSSGAAKLVAHASAGRDQVVAFHFPGDLVVVPARAEHRYTLSGMRSGAFLVFDYPEFTEQARTEPAVLRILLESTRTSLGRCRDKSLALGRKTAPERLAGFLVGIGQRIGTPQDDALFVDLPMSRRDIADSLGLTIETVSRQFTALRQSGLIATIGNSGVRIPDLDALELRAGYLRGAA